MAVSLASYAFATLSGRFQRESSVIRHEHTIQTKDAVFICADHGRHYQNEIKNDGKLFAILPVPLYNKLNGKVVAGKMEYTTFFVKEGKYRAINAQFCHKISLVILAVSAIAIHFFFPPLSFFPYLLSEFSTIATALSIERYLVNYFDGKSLEATVETSDADERAKMTELLTVINPRAMNEHSPIKDFASYYGYAYDLIQRMHAE